MPDTETVAPEQPSFADHRKAMISGDRPKIELLKDTPISSQSAEDPEKGDPKHGAASETAKGQEFNNVDKRKAEIQREINSDLERKRIAKQEADAEEARLARLKAPDVKATPTEQPGVVAPAYDGTDKSDPKPERPKKPNDKVDASGKEWANWPEYQAALDKYEEDMESFRTANAAWTARAEWRKADKLKLETAARETATAQVNKDLADFESTAKDWAKAEKIEDFMDLFAEIKKRPVLSAETGSVTMYGGEDGARLLYELMVHPEKLEEIEKMPRSIDRLNALYEMKYSLKPVKSEERRPAQDKPRSAAPAPGTRVSGGGQGSSSKEPKNFHDYQTKRFGT